MFHNQEAPGIDQSKQMPILEQEQGSGHALARLPYLLLVR